MTRKIVLRAALLWFVIASLAVINGVLREKLITPLLGSSAALPLSGLILTLAIFLISFFAIGFLGTTSCRRCLLVGAQWFLMTLAFEFIFGHFVAGKSWSELLTVFDFRQGDLFSLVLLSTVLSPCIATRIRNKT